MQSFFRRTAQVLYDSKGIRWTGDNTGTITPSLSLGKVVDVTFANFTGDNLFVSDDQYPYLEELIVDTSTTLTNIQLPAMTGAKQATFQSCTGQSNLTITGAALTDMFFNASAYTNINLTVSVTNSVQFLNCTANAPLVCTLPAGLVELVMSLSAYTTIPTLPSGLHQLLIVDCPNITRASINAALVALDAMAATGQVINLSGTTPFPSQVGLTAAASIIGRSGTVTIPDIPFDIYGIADASGGFVSVDADVAVGDGDPIGDLYLNYKVNGTGPFRLLISPDWPGPEITETWDISDNARSTDEVEAWFTIEVGGIVFKEGDHLTFTMS